MSKKKVLNINDSVRSLSIKVYDEQLVQGWDNTVQSIKSIDKNIMQVIGICHNQDINSDDIWECALEKPHYHIIVRILNKKQKSISTILKLLGVAYRKGLDDSLWRNHGVETVGNFQSMATYLTHETDQALLDGKHVYNLEELVSNLTIDEIKLIREGYIRVSSSVYKVSYNELIALDDQAFTLGYELRNFDEWYNNQPFGIRSHAKLNTIIESYYRGVKTRVDEHTELIRLCVFIQGTPNTGKSYAAESSLKGYNILKISGGGTGKFDNLKPYTDAIIIDDDVCPNLLNVSDNYMTSVYRRNKNNPIWTGKYLIVTSNLTFNCWLEQCGINKAEHIDAMCSRFYICELKKVSDYNCLYCLSPSMRGNYEQQFERKRMFIEFRDRYNASLKEYVLSTDKVDYSDVNGDFDVNANGSHFIQLSLF